MTVCHHPSDESILAYANGSLSRPLALVAGAHVSGCAKCRQALAVAETLGGLFLDLEPPAPMPADSFARVLERLNTQAESLPSAQPFSLYNAGFRRWLAPGIWIRPISKERGGKSRAYLLGAAPGKALPRHRHNGLEMTQVLEGEFFDGGMRYGPGDFLEAGDDVEHSLRVGADKACVCLIASQGVPKGIPGLLMRLMT